MADAFSTVRSGDPLTIHADAWNAMLDVVRRSRSTNHTLDADGPSTARNITTILVKNTSTASFPRFGAMQLDGAIFTPSPSDPTQDLLSRVVMKGKNPSPRAGHGLLAILLEPLSPGRIGRAAIDGVIGTRINVIDEQHKSADVPSSTQTPSGGAFGDQALLESSHCGSVDILWKEPGTGPRFAIVRLGRSSNTMPFVAVIGYSESIGVNRWKYQWLEASLSNGDFAYGANWYGGTDGAVDGIDYAYNTCEWLQHEDASAVGPGVLLSNIPEGFEVKPVALYTAVVMHRVWTGTGMGYVFTCPNAIDGTCPTSLAPGGGGGEGELPLP